MTALIAPPDREALQSQLEDVRPQLVFSSSWRPGRESNGHTCVWNTLNLGIFVNEQQRFSSSCGLYIVGENKSFALVSMRVKNVLLMHTIKKLTAIGERTAQQLASGWNFEVSDGGSVLTIKNPLHTPVISKHSSVSGKITIAKSQALQALLALPISPVDHEINRLTSPDHALEHLPKRIRKISKAVNQKTNQKQVEMLVARYGQLQPSRVEELVGQVNPEQIANNQSLLTLVENINNKQKQLTA